MKMSWKWKKEREEKGKNYVRVVNGFSYNHLIEVAIRFLGIPSSPLPPLLLLRVNGKMQLLKIARMNTVYESRCITQKRIVTTWYVYTVVDYLKRIIPDQGRKIYL